MLTILTVTLGIIFLLGSIGGFKALTVFLALANFITLLGYRLLTKGDLKIPKFYIYYLFLLVFLLIHTLIFKGDTMFFWLFAMGGAGWLAVNNFKDFFSKHLLTFLVTVALILTSMFLYVTLSGVVIEDPDNLISPATALLAHSNIGTLWAIVLLAIIYDRTKQKKDWHIPVIGLGMIVLFMALSRAALLTLTTGLFVMFSGHPLGKSTKRILYVILVLVALYFLHAGMYKSTLFSRPYFFEAILGIYNNPMGIGMGNFGKVLGSSNFVHNLLLEFLSGMGIFSIPFIYWFWMIFTSIKGSKENGNLHYAILIALFVSFLFDTTYIIPPFLMIWFAALALI